MKFNPHMLFAVVTVAASWAVFGYIIYRILVDRCVDVPVCVEIQL